MVLENSFFRHLHEGEDDFWKEAFDKATAQGCGVMVFVATQWVTEEATIKASYKAVPWPSIPVGEYDITTSSLTDEEFAHYIRAESGLDRA